ncbi:MAG: hypothetical protein ACI4IW_02370 [Oscillospiraceae bacterium]
MILHITFSDGSNPWICSSDDRHEIAEHWREWEKNHPWEARPVAYCGSIVCERADDNAGYWIYTRGQFWDTVKRYKHLGHALAALERLGGETV